MMLLSLHPPKPKKITFFHCFGIKSITLIKKEVFQNGIKLMKEKALRKHSLYEKTAASVLLKLFIMSYKEVISSF